MTDHSQRDELAQAIAQRIDQQVDALSQAWAASTPVKHVVIDDLLPVDTAGQIAASFPDPQTLMQRKSLKERKRVGIDVSHYDPIIGDILFAFHQPCVIAAVTRVTGLLEMTADPTLYASGLSVMGQGDFLNPHKDNSHDGDRQKYRVLNLLYYLCDDWSESAGGNLELWNDTVTRNTTVVSGFNRLVLMGTDDTSWHSVSQVTVDRPRRCVSNYYFSDKPLCDHDYSHVTTFAGRPEETIKRQVLKVDSAVLNTVGKMFPSLTKHTKHRIKDDQESDQHS